VITFLKKLPPCVFDKPLDGRMKSHFLYDLFGQYGVQQLVRQTEAKQDHPFAPESSSFGQDPRQIKARVGPEKLRDVADFYQLKITAAGIFRDLDGEHEQRVCR
jgi:hypothetical protein